MEKESKSIWVVSLSIAGILLALPLVARPYQISLLTEMIIFSLYAVSYNLLLGFGGLLSFGHGMFLGVGAFTTGAMLQRIPGLPFFGAVFLGTLLATLVGLGLGCLLLRHKGLTMCPVRDVLVLRLRQQAITLAGLARQPLHVSLGVVPALR